MYDLDETFRLTSLLRRQKSVDADLICMSIN